MAARKVALVTGASRGIGRGIALRLAESGMDIAFTYKDELDSARAVSEEIRALGARCVFFRVNVEQLDAAYELADRAFAELGRLDAVICNGARDERVSILNITPAHIEVLASRLYCGQIMCAAGAARSMVRRGVAGSIVFITSIHGQMAVTSDFIYGGMKAALERSAKSLALELSPYRIRVNCVAPGAINVRNVDDSTLKYPYSKMVPLGRRGEPDDIARAVEFLISDNASYITGQTLAVEGGFSLAGPSEGWAEVHTVDMGFVERAYEEMQKSEEKPYV